MKVSTSILTTCLLLSSAAGLHAAMLVDGSVAGTLVDNGFNTSAAVYTSTSDNFNERNVHGARFNTQTFQVGSAFTLDAVYIEYQAPGSGYSDGDFTLTIYNVADVTASSLTLGSPVVSGTFTSNSTTRASAGFTSSSSVTSLLEFDFTGSDEVSIAATSGTAGYAIQFTTNTGTNPVFNWQRSGQSGDAYAGGSSYETGSINSGLDYAVAFTAVAIPEPSSAAALAGALAVGVAMTKRRRRSA